MNGRRRIGAIHQSKDVAGISPLDALHIREVAEERHVRIGIQRLETESPRIELAPQRRHRLVEHFPAPVDHHHVLAHLLGVRHDVRREQDRGAAPMLVDDQLAQQSHAHRIEPAERLVENEQVRLVDDGGDELHALQHALREILAALPHGLGKPDAIEETLVRAPQHPRRQPLQLPHVGEEGADPHLAVDAALFRQVADAILGLERRWPAKHRQLSGVRKENRHDHADAGGLAGAVRSDDAVERAARNDEIHVAHGHRLSECFRDSTEAEGSVHRSPCVRRLYHGAGWVAGWLGSWVAGSSAIRYAATQLLSDPATHAPPSHPATQLPARYPATQLPAPIECYIGRDVRLVVLLCVALAGAGCSRAPEPKEYELAGQIQALAPERREVTIKHGDIKGFMPGMTMPFTVKDEALLGGTEAGRSRHGDAGRRRGRRVPLDDHHDRTSSTRDAAAG